jgi:hypothetical protein
MIGSILYLLLGGLFGFLLLYKFGIKLKIEEKMVWGIPIGIMLLTFWTFLWAIILPNQGWAIFISSTSVIILIIDYLRNKNRSQSILKELKDSLRSLNRKELLAWGIVLIPTIIYSIITIPNLFHFQDGNLVAGWVNIWGDWAVHARNSTFFANQTKLTLENPIYSGTMFQYPYLSSYLSAILQQLGLGIDSSLTLPTMVLFIALPAVLYIFAYRITGKKSAGIIFTYIVLLAGGFGGITKLFSDIFQGNYFWMANSYHPLLYTDLRGADGTYSNSGVWFMNFITSEFFPQRAFLSAIHIALFIFYINFQASYEFFKNWKLSGIRNLKKCLVFSGLLFGILPIIHTHSYIALGIILPVGLFIMFLQNLVLKKYTSFKKYLFKFIKFAVSFFLPAVIIGFSIVFIFVFNPKSTGDMMHFINWWVPNQDQISNPLIYWWNNAGLLIILGVVSFFTEKKFRPYVIGAFVIFILCNFISFQPWHFDNLKLLTYWYIIWALPVSLLLASLKGKLLVVKIVLILLLITTGLADVLSLAVSTGTGIPLSTAVEYKYSQIVRQITKEDDLIVSGTNHDNPISVSSGRRMFLGYEGWLWTYNINSDARMDEVKEMYSGSKVGQDLIKSKGINYMSIGPAEIGQFRPDIEKLTELYPTVLKYESYLLLKCN